MINAGNSSVLLGVNSTNKKRSDNYQKYSVKINELSSEPVLYLNKSIISTSGISKQGVKIGEQTYSHIVNPVTGSAINLYDTVIVISDAQTYGNGALGDALSTSLMMSSLEEINEVENSVGVHVIAIKNDAVVYGENYLNNH